METEKNKHNRKLNRLKDFDYSSDGSYFITICVKNRAEFLSEIIWNDEENRCVGDGEIPLIGEMSRMRQRGNGEAVTSTSLCPHRPAFVSQIGAKLQTNISKLWVNFTKKYLLTIM